MKIKFVSFSPPVPPRIDRKNLWDTIVHENEPIRFDVKVSGEPAPDVEWMINNKSINQTTYRRVENVPYNTKFFNDKPDRRDTGMYKITATNQYGTDSVEIEVTVVCKYLFLSLTNRNSEIDE